MSCTFRDDFAIINLLPRFQEENTQRDINTSIFKNKIERVLFFLVTLNCKGKE